MAKVKIYNLDGTEKEEIDLKDEVFNVVANDDTLHQVTVAMLSNKRSVYAHTKTRGDVRGGGKKPWKQKGTGRARHGSSRSPIWVGGGITFGPRKDRNFNLKINKKTKQKALAMVLSDKLANNEIVAIDAFAVKEPKTKQFMSSIKNLFTKLKKDLKGKTIVISGVDKNIKLAIRNVPNVNYIAGKDLNILDAMTAKNIIIEKKSILELEKRLS
ncbi:MAG: 50S ribosomal protein L4 [Parcubacteria group bacterium CG10_big_fil_rev_8_21_14_0_10_36_14]|nr:MAG: 50S ribosomal protein L4 [Parcubacteria group bacterium CG10_big_fil_rev_8_21_14_0_10_36_14]